MDLEAIITQLQFFLLTFLTIYWAFLYGKGDDKINFSLKKKFLWKFFLSFLGGVSILYVITDIIAIRYSQIYK